MSLSAIVLAGQRQGQVNPIAEAHEVPLKCIAPINGRPLIVHVLDTLLADHEIDSIIVSVNEGLEAPVRAAIGERTVTFAPAKAAIADSVYAAAERTGEGPYFITTADNVLLRTEVVEAVRSALSGGAKALLTLARRRDVMAAHPDGQRNYYAFSDDAYANCNTYAIASRRVLESAEIFREGGQFMKNPSRIAKTFGLWNLLRFRLGMLAMPEAIQSISGRLGIDIRPVILSNGEYAIDVDNERTYRVCEEILRRRQDVRMTPAASAPISAETINSEDRHG